MRAVLGLSPPGGRLGLGFAGLCVGLALAAPAPAAAQDRPPNPHESVSSVSQYVEDIPNASGPGPTGGGGGGTGQPAPLPPSVSDAIAEQGGQDAAALERAATSSELGRPQRELPSGPRVDDALASGESAGSAVASATSTPLLIALLVALAAVAVVLVGVASRRARARA